MWKGVTVFSQMNDDDKRKRAILLLNSLLSNRVKEQERLCQRYPQYADNDPHPKNPDLLRYGGMAEDLDILRYALQPDPEKAETIIDQLFRISKPQLCGELTGTASNVIAEVTWK